MAMFDLVVSALNQGHSVRREDWLPDVRMFVQNDSLMYQHGSVKPWRCALSWNEIAATDWRLVYRISIYNRPHPAPRLADRSANWRLCFALEGHGHTDFVPPAPRGKHGCDFGSLGLAEFSCGNRSRRTTFRSDL